MTQLITTRPAGPGKVPQKQGVPGRPRSTLSSMVTLARWQLRQTGRLPRIIGLGILVAVVLVCAIPLYVQVSLSAGLRHALAADPQNLYLTVHAQGSLFSSQAVSDIQNQLKPIVQRNLGANVADTPDFSVQAEGLEVNWPVSTLSVSAIGIDEQRAASHAKLLQGRLPTASSGNTIEFVTTRQNQQDLGVQLNTPFTLWLTLMNPLSTRPILLHLEFRLVGIIASPDTNDLFWHGESLVPDVIHKGPVTLTEVPVLVSNDELTNALEEISYPYVGENTGTQFTSPLDIYWYYTFNFSHLDINHLPDLSNSLNSVLTAISDYPQSPPYIIGTTALGPLSILQSYSARITVVELPAGCLGYLIASMLLFFVLLLTGVLIERQIEAVALLRSRGATRGQIFIALLSQCVGLCLIAFVAGPLLAILGVIWLATRTLTADTQGALNLLTTNPLQVALGQLERDLLVVGVAILGTAVSTWRVLQTNLLTLKSERARSTQQPFWMRLRLDLVVAMVAVAGFGFSLYVGSPGVLDARTRTLILPLTSLVGVLSLLMGCLLIFLRLFPGILQRGEQLAARSRGAAPMLALAQMARSPRQLLRLMLLFALAVAFALFALIFNQTQARRLSDMALYQVGGDFSGKIPQVLEGDDWNSQLAFYRGIKGVTSVTLGASTFMAGGSDKSVIIDLEAVDSSTYASTIYWPTENGSQTLSSLMAPLRAGQKAPGKNGIPAIIDDAAAQALDVGMGQQFVLSDFHGPITLVVAGIVHYLPTVYDSANATGLNGDVAQGGVLIDFQTYSTVEMNTNQNGIVADRVWMRASARPADLANVRNILFHGTYELENGEDRRALAQNLATDPLYKAIVGILVLGALIALLLGLVGNLLVTWWNARSRRTSFALLRALGCTSGQIAYILLWEQGIVYATGLLVGVVLSVVFSLVILPSFIFSPVSDAGTAQAFYVAQSVPAVQVALPIGSMLMLLAGLIVICVLALLLMLRVVIQPQVSQTLRLDED